MVTHFTSLRLWGQAQLPRTSDDKCPFTGTLSSRGLPTRRTSIRPLLLLALLLFFCLTFFPLCMGTKWVVNGDFTAIKSHRVWFPTMSRLVVGILFWLRDGCPSGAPLWLFSFRRLNKKKKMMSVTGKYVKVTTKYLVALVKTHFSFMSRILNYSQHSHSCSVEYI